MRSARSDLRHMDGPDGQRSSPRTRLRTSPCSGRLHSTRGALWGLQSAASQLWLLTCSMLLAQPGVIGPTSLGGQNFRKQLLEDRKAFWATKPAFAPQPNRQPKQSSIVEWQPSNSEVRSSPSQDFIERRKSQPQWPQSSAQREAMRGENLRDTSQ